MNYAEAASILQQRMAARERNFLEVLRWGVFENGRSPYRELLDLRRAMVPWQVESGVTR